MPLGSRLGSRLLEEEEEMINGVTKETKRYLS